MNKQCHRVVFNKKRGQLMAVAETAISQGKSASGECATEGASPGKRFAAWLRPVAFASLVVAHAVAFFANQGTAWAQVVADPNAPGNQRPTVLAAPNGTPVVNIQTPSASGVSRNTYSQFDVQQNGVILNNSRGNVQTQLGGWIQGNQWLATGSARVILNEVNSSNPSQIRGYIEVAGQRAEVIVANAAGVVIDGGGFINASRATVTTGTPVINSGSLESFVVQRGAVVIEGRGFDASLTDYTGIMARAVQINAGVWAKDLQVITGANTITTATGDAGVTAAAATDALQGTAPAFALDVAQLGGMYAGKIRLIGTENGVGVRNAGEIAAGGAATAGTVVIDTSGWLSSSGQIQAAGNLQINTHGALSNSGQIASNQDVGLRVAGLAGALHNSGNVEGAGRIAVSAQTLDNSGRVAALGSIDVQADQSARNSGQIASSRELTLQSAALDNRQGQLQAGRIDITAESLDNRHGRIWQDGAQNLNLLVGAVHNGSGQIGNAIVQPPSAPSAPAAPAPDTAPSPTPSATPSPAPAPAPGAAPSPTPTPTPTPAPSFAAGRLQVSVSLSNDAGLIGGHGNTDLNASAGLSNSGSVNVGSLQVRGAAFNNDGGHLAANTADIQVQYASNVAGQVQANRLQLSADSLDNAQGQVSARQDATLRSNGSINNQQGQLLSGGALHIAADGAMSNQAGVIQADAALSVRTAALDNTGGHIGSGANSTVAATDLNNAAGTIRAEGDLHVAASGSLSNANVGTTQASITAGGNNTLAAGSLRGNGVLGAGLQADGRLASSSPTAAGLAVSVEGAASLNGNNVAAGPLRLSATQLDLSGSITSARDIHLNAANGSVNTSNAQVAADNALSITAAQALTTNAGSLSAHALTLNAASLNNSAGGKIVQSGAADQRIEMRGSLNNDGGLIQSNAANLSIGAGSISNRSGLIQRANVSGSSSGALTIGSASGVDAQSGAIVTDGALSVQARGGDILLQNASTQGSRVALQASGAVNNSGGQVLGTEQVVINAGGALNNEHGQVQSQQGGVSIAAASLNNRTGNVQAAQDLNIDAAGSLANTSQGQLYAGANQRLNVAGELRNDGLIAAQGGLNITAGSVSNTQLLAAGLNSRGQLNGGSLVVTAGGAITSTAGSQNLAGASVSLAGASLDLAGSTTSARDVALSATAGPVNTSSAQVIADNALTVNAAQTLANTGGTMSANTVALNVASLDNSAGGKIVQSGTGAQRIEMTGVLNNDGGAIESNASSLTIDAGHLNNRAGVVQRTNVNGDTSGTLNIGAATGIDGQGGLIASSGALSLQARSGDIQLHGATTQAHRVALQASGAVNNSGGQVLGTEQVIVSAGGDVNNEQGQVQSQQGGVSIAAASLNNRTGNVQAAQDLSVDAAGNLSNTQQGQLYAGAHQRLNVAGQLSNDSLIAALGDLTITAGSVSNTQILAAGLNGQGQIRGGHLAVNARDAFTSTAGSQNLAGTRALLSGARLDLAGSTTSARDVALTATAGNVNTSAAQVTADNTLTVNAARALVNTGGTLNANALALNVASLDNSAGGQIVQSGSSAQRMDMAGALNNDGGVIQSNAANLSIDAFSISNRGGLIQRANLNRDSGGTLNIGSAGGIDGQAGAIVTDGALSVQARGGDIQLQNASTEAHRVDLRANAAVSNNHGQILGTNQVVINAGGELRNEQGQVQSQHGSVTLNAASLSNRAGHVQAAQDLDVNTTDGLSNIQQGELRAGVNQRLNVGGQFVNDSLVTAQGDLTITAGSVTNSRLLAAGLNSQGQIVGGHLAVTANGTITSTAGSQNLAGASANLSGASLELAGSTTSAADVSLSARTGHVDTSAQARVIAGNHLTVTAAQALNNSDRGALSANRVSLNVGSLNNSNGGQIVQSGTAAQTIATAGTLNNDGGVIGSNATSLNIDAASLSNRAGLIQRANTDRSTNGTLNVGSASGIEGQGGVIVTDGALTLQARGGDMLLQNASTEAHRVALQASGSVNNTQGQVLGTSQVTINAGGALVNEQGQVQSQQGGVSITAASVSNRAGNIQSAQDLSVDAAGNLANTQAGQMVADGNQRLNVGAQLSNDNLIAAQGDLTITAGSVNNAQILAAGLNGQGQISGGNLAVTTSGAITSAAGSQNLAGASATLSGASLELAGSTTSASDVALTATAGDVNTSAGARVIADNALTVNATQALINTGGSLSAHTVSLNVGSLNNSVGGQIVQSGTAAQTIAMAGALNNDGGFIESNAASLSIDAANLSNRAGLIQRANLNRDSSGTLSIGSVAGIDGQGGAIITDGALSVQARGGDIQLQNANTEAHRVALQASGAVNNTQGVILGTSQVSVTAGGALVNERGQVQSQQGGVSVAAASVNNRDGDIQAAQDLIVEAGSLTNTAQGQIYAGANQRLNVAGQLSNDNLIAARGDLTITAGSVANSRLLAAGLNSQGQIVGGHLAVTASGAITSTAGSQNLAGASATLSGASLELAGSTTSAGDVALTATAGDVNTSAGARVIADNALTVNATQALINTGGSLSAHTVSLNVGRLNNSNGGQIVQSGTAAQTIAMAGALNNDGGVIESNAAGLSIDAASLSNRAGLIQRANTDHSTNGTLTVGSASGIEGQGGVIVTDGALTLQARGGDMQLQNASTEAHRVALQASGSVNNTQGQVLGTSQVTINAGGVLSNERGQVQSQQGGVAVNAASADNRDGDIQAAQDLSVEAGSLANTAQGQLYAGGNQRLTIAGTFINDNLIAARGDLAITAGSATNSRLLAAGLNSQGQIVGGHLAVTASGVVTSTVGSQNLAGASATLSGTSLELAGSTTSAADVSLNATAGSVNTSTQARVIADNSLTVTATQALNNSDRGTLSANTVALNVGSLNNSSGGLIAQSGTAAQTIAMSGALNNDGGFIESNAASLNIDAASLSNRAGLIQRANIDRSTNGTLTVGSASGLEGQGGVIVTDGALTLQARGGDMLLQNASTEAHRVALLASGSVNNTQGAILGTSQVTVTAGGALVNERGQVQSQQGGVSINVRSIDNRDGDIQAAQDLIVQADSLANTAQGQLYAGANQRLNIAGQLSNDNLIAARGDLIVTAGSVTNSRLLAAGLNSQGQIVGGHLAVTASGAITSTAGSQNLAGASARLSASSLELAGSTISADDVSLTATTGNLNTSAQALVVARNNLTVTAAQALNNSQRGALSGGSVTLNVGSLDNSAAGQILQTGASAQRIDVTGALNNDGGVVHSNAASLTVEAGSLSNRGGWIERANPGRASTGDTGGMLSIGSATGIDSQGGTITTDGALTLHARGGDLLLHNTGALRTGVQAQGVELRASGALNNSLNRVLSGAALIGVAGLGVDNAQGVFAADGQVSLNAATLNNTQGYVGSFLSGVDITTAGLTLNHSGSIEAAGHIRLHSNGLSNIAWQAGAPSGFVLGGSLGIDTRGHMLDNTGGTLAARTGLQIDSGALVNEAGAIQSSGSLRIDTHGQALTNTRSASHQSGEGGIVAGGNATLVSAHLDNRAGYIGSGGALTATATQVDNRAGGRIVSESSIHLTATGLDNRGGQVQSLGDITVNAAGGVIDNTASLIRGGGTVTLTAETLVNANTQGADQGIEGRDLNLNATTLNNQQGAIRASNNATITARATINNQQGLISANNNLTLQDPATQRQLAIVNTGGTLIADNMLTVSAASLSGDGKVLSQGNMSVNLTQDFSQNGEFIANGNATLTTTGNVVNNTQLRAGGTLTVTGANVQNNAGAEINGGATIVNTATGGTLSNRGLIDGLDTQINAGTLNNLGTGRIYGDTLSIAAQTVNNLAESGRSATIAARADLRIGAQTLNNRDDSLIFSAGDIAIGGALDAQRNVIGMAAQVNNASATIEALGNLSLATSSLRNTNEYFTTTLGQPSAPVQGIYILPQGAQEKLPIASFRWENWSRAGQYRYVTLPPAGTGVLGSTPIPRVGEEDCVGDEPNQVCTPRPGADYSPSDPAWAHFGLTPPTPAPDQPTLALPVAPDPTRASVCDTASPSYSADACAVYNADVARYNTDKAAYDAAWASYQASFDTWALVADPLYEALDNAIEAYNQSFAGAEIRAWTQYDLTRSEQRTEVLSSAPARILSGGNMTLTGHDLVNDKSHIIAGRTLSATLAQVQNVDAEGVRIVRESGTSQSTWSRWRGGFRRYHQRDWGPVLAYNPADEVTTINLPVAQQRQNANVSGSGATLNPRQGGGTSQTAAQATQAQAAADTTAYNDHLDGAPRATSARAATGRAVAIAADANVGSANQASEATAAAAAAATRHTSGANTALNTSREASAAEADDTVQTATASTGESRAAQAARTSQAGSTVTAAAATAAANAAREASAADAGDRVQTATVSTGASREAQAAQAAQAGNAVTAAAATVAGATGISGLVAAVAQDAVALARDAAVAPANAASVATAAAAAPTPEAVAPAPSGIDVSTAMGATVRTVAPNATVPSASLYTLHNSAEAGYFVETDPRFADYRQWLGSDYLLGALSLDPAATQRRLGDGFYEQRLIREQVAQLTGQRFLGNYSSDEAQYMALMNNAVAFAQTHNLRPGIALSEAQMAQLTSDIVWLVEQDVTLPNGQVVRALVPQLYVRVQPGELDGSGALIAGQDVRLNLSSDLTNSASIAGRRVVSITAENIHNLGGRIHGDMVGLEARNDLNNVGGSIGAASLLDLQAGRDINVQTTTRSATNTTGASTFSRNNVDRVAGLYVTGDQGLLLVNAGRDINLTGATVDNTGAGSHTDIRAGRDLNLNTVRTERTDHSVADARNYRRDSQSTDIGSRITGAGNVTLHAGQDLNARAASVQAAGALNATAERDIKLEAGQAATSFTEAHHIKNRSAVGSTTRTSVDQVSSTQALQSNLGGNTVNLQAGRDLTVQGANIASDTSTRLHAGNNLTITTAQSTQDEAHHTASRRSGITTQGVGIHAGSTRQSNQVDTQSVSQVASTIGSVHGNVNLFAGSQATIQGSQVIAPSGDISVQAQRVQITDVHNTVAQQSETRFRQSGVSASISNPVIAAAQSIQSTVKAIEQTQDDRMRALGAATIGLNLYNNAGAIKNALRDPLGQEPGKNADGSANPDKAPAHGPTVSVSVGSSSSQSNSQTTHSQSQGSSLAAGGNVTISATGAGEQSNLRIQGSQVRADGTVSLSADNRIELASGQSTTTETNSNRSSSASLGVSVDVKGQTVGITASASQGRGQGSGSSTTQSNTQIAGNTVTLNSGGDTDIKGAVIKANTVQAEIGGSLNIQSQQDSATYKERQSSAGGSVTVGPAPGGSVNASRTRIDSDYRSVGEQSGIRAGDGGFQVNVAGATNLTGGAITSTQAAVEQGNNRLVSQGGITTSDLQNQAQYRASSVSVSAGTTAGSTSAGIGQDSGRASSTTQAAISGIAGNQAARTGDAEAGIAPIFDRQRVTQEVTAQAQITAEFGRQAPMAVANYAGRQEQSLREQARQEADPDKRRELNAQADRWAEGGDYRVALHTATGALSGGLAGAAGAYAAAEAAPALDSLQADLKKEIANSLQQAGVSTDAASRVAGAISTLAINATGAALTIGSGSNAAAMALNIDANNRQLHPSEARIIRDNARRYAEQRFGTNNPTSEQIAQAAAELTQQTLRNADTAHAARLGDHNAQAQGFLVDLGLGQTRVDGLTGQTYQLFTADAATRDNHAMFGQYAQINPEMRAALDNAYAQAFRPPGAQTISGLNGTNAGALTGSDLALNDAARDYGHMRQQPEVVQRAVLAQLRQERLDNQQTQLALLQELQQLNAGGSRGPEAASRREQIDNRLNQLASEDQTLRQASVEQIRAMGSIGLLSPVYQREWAEGAGEAIAASRLSFAGVSAASLSGRINMLRGAVEESRVATTAARAEAQAAAQARVDNNANRDGGVDPYAARDSGFPTEHGGVPPKVTANANGTTDIVPGPVPQSRRDALNTTDVGGSGGKNPAEATAAAQIEPAIGTMQRYDGPPTYGDKSPDYEITSGPNAGRTVELMYTTSGGTTKEVDGMNRFFERNMTVPGRDGVPPGIQQIQEHLLKAEIVVMDFRTLTPANQQIVMNYINTLTPAQRSQVKIIK